MDISGLSSGE